MGKDQSGNQCGIIIVMKMMLEIYEKDMIITYSVPLWTLEVLPESIEGETPEVR